VKVAIARDDPIFGEIQKKTYHRVNGSIQGFGVPMVLTPEASRLDRFYVGWMFDDTAFLLESG